MRAFSIMGAYALIANNELMHLGMFIAVCSISIIGAPISSTDEGALSDDSMQCYESMDK
jgi:hypothetical protein